LAPKGKLSASTFPQRPGTVGVLSMPPGTERVSPSWCGERSQQEKREGGHDQSRLSISDAQPFLSRSLFLSEIICLHNFFHLFTGMNLSRSLFYLFVLSYIMPIDIYLIFCPPIDQKK